MVDFNNIKTDSNHVINNLKSLSKYRNISNIDFNESEIIKFRTLEENLLKINKYGKIINSSLTSIEIDNSKIDSFNKIDTDVNKLIKLIEEYEISSKELKHLAGQLSVLRKQFSEIEVCPLCNQTINHNHDNNGK